MVHSLQESSEILEKDAIKYRERKTYIVYNEMFEEGEAIDLIINIDERGYK